MIRNSFKFLLFSLILIICVSACRKTAAPEQAAEPSSPVVEHQPQGGKTPVQTKYFTGSIGSTLGLQMKLVREGDSLTGSYFYKKVGKKIELRGAIDQDGNVMLEEFDTGGNSTGVFKGLWKTNQDSLAEIKGDWSKPGSDQKTPFSLDQDPIEFSSEVEVVAKQVKENNKKLKYEIDGEYPQLMGAADSNFQKFNQIARSHVLKKVNDFRKEMNDQTEEETPLQNDMGSSLGVGYKISFARDDLISVQFDVGTYYAGAAHPNSYSDVINFDLRNGKILKLSDLFKPGSKYLQAVSNYAVSDLKKQSTQKGADSMLDEDWIQRGAGPSAENYRSWTITKKGLGINFDSYQVAPYAAGPQHVLVPFSVVKDLVKTDGPVAQFVPTV